MSPITLTSKQRGVVKGMVTGVVMAVLIVVGGVMLNPFSFTPDTNVVTPIEVAIRSLLVCGAFLVISVGRLAKHRFFTPDDIDGGGLSRGTERARVLQSLLQNTLEQFGVAATAYLAWAVLMPTTWMSVVPLAAGFFCLGRILFFIGYHEGAPSRAFGFTLSFYPAVIMILLSLISLFARLFA